MTTASQLARCHSAWCSEVSQMMATGWYPHPPAWTGYRPSVTIDGNAYEQLEYQFISRRRKLTIHRRRARDDGGLRRRRFSRTLDHIRSSSVKNMKVNSRLCTCLQDRITVFLWGGGHTVVVSYSLLALSSVCALAIPGIQRHSFI